MGGSELCSLWICLAKCVGVCDCEERGNLGSCKNRVGAIPFAIHCAGQILRGRWMSHAKPKF